METAIQNLAKSPWFKINNVLCKCKACYNVHVWFNHAIWLLVNRKWCYWNSPAYWNSRQFSIITRHGNSSLVFLGLALALPFSEGRTLHTVDWTKVQKVPSIFNFAVHFVQICTPFCIKGKPCLKYHDLLVAILECPHIKDKRGKDRRRNPWSRKE